MFVLTIAAIASIPRVHAAEPSLSQPVVEVAAFGVAPVTGIADDSVPRPGPRDLVLHRETPDLQQTQEHDLETRVLFGETWLDLFRRLGEKVNPEVLANPELTGRADLLPALQPGKYVRLHSIHAGDAVQAEYVVMPEEAYSITLNRTAVQVKRHASDPRLVASMRADASKASLFTATDAIGLPEEIVLQLAEIFSDEVDFHRELHRGYRATIVYEMLYREGHIDRPGRILAAEFDIRNRRLQAYYFEDGRGRTGYFSETGKSLKKAFRKSPVEFSRVTSEYTLARFHPILGLWRAHRGTDYAAPIGSKVMAMADGTVDYMGAQGELGNLVIIRHFGRFLTYYGHLSEFARGLAVGAKVEKGQLIGYVGMTGLTTGPHVHFEFRAEDAAGEPVSIPVPPEVLEEPPLSSNAFFAAVRGYRNQLQVAQQTHFVILD